MVAGQPVCVQSPARNSPGIAVDCPGRQRSTPGSGEKVAAASLMTEIGRAPRLNSSHGYISYAVFCLKKKSFRVGAIRAEPCKWKDRPVTQPISTHLRRKPRNATLRLSARRADTQHPLQHVDERHRRR